MNRLLSAALASLLGVLPAAADEFTDTLESALKAYGEGDVKAAGEDLSYATKLLNSQKASALGRLLPPAPAGWTRTDDNTDDAAIGAQHALGDIGGAAALAVGIDHDAILARLGWRHRQRVEQRLGRTQHGLGFAAMQAAHRRLGDTSLFGDTAVLANGFREAPHEVVVDGFGLVHAQQCKPLSVCLVTPIG